MKKLIVMITVTAILVLGTTGLVSANGGPHGGFTATTDACAGCHRAHTETGPNLLIVSSSFDLCLSCHGSTGLGANTNVDDGYYLSSRDDTGSNGDEGAANTPDNSPLLGGGFVFYQGAAVTSSHDMAGAGNTALAWGNGGVRGVATDISDPLSCASCHDPHGSPNYRIINAAVNGTGVVVPQVDEGAAKDYDTEQWGAGTSDLCAACHGAYHVTSAGSGSDAAVAVNGGYTHRVDMPYVYGANSNPETVGMAGYTLPLAESGTNNMVVCMTCHLPHGTSVQMMGIADGGPDGTGTLPGDTTATDSALLRLENRGVCEVCHQK